MPSELQNGTDFAKVFFMMNLLAHYFDILIQCAGACYFAICVVLLFFHVPNTDEYLPYRKAKRCLATTYLVMGLNLVAWLMLSNTEGWKVLDPYVKFADFIFFYLEGIFFCYSFYHLVNEQYLSKWEVRKDWTIFGVSSCLMALSVMADLGEVGVWMARIAFSAFFVQVVIFLRRFNFLYNEKKKTLDNYFAEDMQLFIFWIKKSLFFIILTGVLSFASLLFGLIYNYLFQVYVISANFYIAISFINYAPLYAKLKRAEAMEREKMEMAEEESDSNVEYYEQLFGDRMMQWLLEKKYLSSQLTIEDMAQEMGTNKLYMSRYINRKYGVNFRTWVTQLRLIEAKEYMRQNPNVKQEEVASHSGFSSSSYFSKMFSRIEGMTPAAWRKKIG